MSPESLFLCAGFHHFVFVVAAVMFGGCSNLRKLVRVSNTSHHFVFVVAAVFFGGCSNLRKLVRVSNTSRRIVTS